MKTKCQYIESISNKYIKSLLLDPFNKKQYVGTNRKVMCYLEKWHLCADSIL